MIENKISIKSIHIKNFRSIRNVVLNVENYNTFVGLNDAGKSNLLKALNLFFNNQTDYGNSFDFSTDFSYLFPKNSHNTREIKIKVMFSIPSGFRDCGDIIWEKSWRTNHYFKEKMVTGNGKELGSRSRVPFALKQIRFRYIPAVKSKDYYKGLLSDLYIAASASLANPLKESIDKLSKDLKDYADDINQKALSHLKLSSHLSMPNNLSDVFKALTFKTTDGIIDSSVDLEKRGDGIQARHIPFILKYIADEDTKSASKKSPNIYTIWGFEEPENGLELTKSFEMAQEFLEYSKSIQMFVSTHSPAFYQINNKENSRTFYVNKKETGETVCSDNISDNYLASNMGLMPLVAPFIEEKQRELENIKKVVGDSILHDQDTILVEGKYDKKYLHLAIERYSPELLKKIQTSELRIYTKDGKGGCNQNVNLAKSWYFSGHKSKLYVIFDNDEAGRESRQKLQEFFETIKNKNTRIKNQFWEWTEEMLSYLSIEKTKRILPIVEVEHFLSKQFWEILKDKNKIEEKSVKELNTMFECHLEKDKSILEVVQNIRERLNLDDIYFDMYNPKDSEKEHIYQLLKQEFDSNKETEALSGLEPTIKKLEEYFVK